MRFVYYKSGKLYNIVLFGGCKYNSNTSENFTIVELTTIFENRVVVHDKNKINSSYKQKEVEMH